MADNGKLTARQERFATAMMGSRNIAEAAKLARVGRRTADRWMADPVFRAALDAAQAEAFTEACRRLVGALGGSLDVLVELRDGSDSDTVRERAAGRLFDIAVRLRELTSIEERLARLESEHEC